MTPTTNDTARTAAKGAPTKAEAAEKAKLAYSVPEACAALGVKTTTLYELFASGRLKRVKLGARTLIPADSLRAFVASLPEAA